jgi:heme exporter protein D
MTDFFAMGGYASFVWPAYAVFFIVLAIDALTPRLQRRRLLQELRGRLQRRASRDRNGSSS